jgi:hypothetical protein
MASIRKRRDKWQVQIRRKGRGALSRTFHGLKDAEAWARHMEVQADRGDLPAHPEALRGITLGRLVERYRDTVSPRKRTHQGERLFLNAFLRHPICRRPVSDIGSAPVRGVPPRLTFPIAKIGSEKSIALAPYSRAAVSAKS